MKLLVVIALLFVLTEINFARNTWRGTNARQGIKTPSMRRNALPTTLRRNLSSRSLNQHNKIKQRTLGGKSLSSKYLSSKKRPRQDLKQRRRRGKYGEPRERTLRCKRGAELQCTNTGLAGVFKVKHTEPQNEFNRLYKQNKPFSTGQRKRLMESRRKGEEFYKKYQDKKNEDEKEYNINDVSKNTIIGFDQAKSLTRPDVSIRLGPDGRGGHVWRTETEIPIIQIDYQKDEIKRFKRIVKFATDENGNVVHMFEPI